MKRTRHQYRLLRAMGWICLLMLPACASSTKDRYLSHLSHRVQSRPVETVVGANVWPEQQIAFAD